MDTSKIKKVGTREEVFKNIALRTAGGLKKDDIIEKRIGNRILYISKKLSDKMKENINILRTHNPNFLKRIQKKTIVNTNDTQSTAAQSIAAQHNATQPLISILKKKQNTGTHAKTQKLSFKVDDNSVKTIFYPELKGINLKELKEEILREEAEEDLGIKLPKKKLEDFSIDEMPDIDISNLD
jgi:hypothetical protein